MKKTNNPFAGIEQKSKNALGVFTKVVNDLLAINEESTAIRGVNDKQIEVFDNKIHDLDVKNGSLVSIEIENDRVIEQINNILNK